MKNIEEIREQIYSLLGKHLIRFQTVEMQLKYLLKQNKTVIFENKDSPSLIEPSVQNQTLGGLSTKALKSIFFVDPPEEDTSIAEPTNHLRLDIKISFNLCEHSYQRLNLQFQTFVNDRNLVAHHFQEKYDLSDFDECKNAVKFLLDLEKKHKPFLDQIDQYCSTANKTLETQIDFLKSDLFKTRLIFPLDEIYKEIANLINNNKKNDGWISITTVIASINKIFPYANKKIKMKYGFKNLHDLILNTGLFLLKIEPTIKGKRILIKPNSGEAVFQILDDEK